MPTKHIYSILENANEIKDKEERIKYIRENRNSVIDVLFKMNYDPSIEFDLPEGEPPYTPYRPASYDAYGHIYQEINRIQRLFLKGNYSDMPSSRKESLFIGTLEFIDKDDAKVLLAVKDKVLQKLFPNLKEKIIKEAIPELF